MQSWLGKVSKIVNRNKIFLHLQKIWYNVVRVGEI